MCTNDFLSLSFENAVKAADEVMRKKNPKLRRITKLMVSRKTRAYAYFCYYYLRWVDDYIDDNKRNLENKKNFLTQQLKLITSILGTQKIQPNFTEEYFLFYLIEYLRSQQKTNLISLVITMLNTISQDINRLENNGIFSESEMQKYFEGQAKTTFRIVNFFLHPQLSEEYDDKFTCLLTLAQITLFRDLADDLDLGYINISKEDIIKFELSTNDLLRDKKLKYWYEEKISSCKKRLNEDIRIVKQLPFKLKLFWFWLYPYCNHKLNRLKIYEYNPTKLKQKKFVNEVILYLTACFNTVKAFFIVFITF